MWDNFKTGCNISLSNPGQICILSDGWQLDEEKTDDCVEAPLQIAALVLPCCSNQDSFTATWNIQDQKCFSWFLYALSNLRHTCTHTHTHTERMSALCYLRLRDLFKDSRRFVNVEVGGGGDGRLLLFPPLRNDTDVTRISLISEAPFVTVLRVPCTRVKVRWHIYCSGRCCHPENHIQPLDAPPFTRIASLTLQTWLPGLLVHLHFHHIHLAWFISLLFKTLDRVEV